MIPRLQFWPLDNFWLNKGSMDFKIYMAVSEKNLYPETLTAEHLAPKCLQADASIIAGCPAYGMRHWMMTFNTWFVQDWDTGFVQHFNETIKQNWLRYMMSGTTTSFLGIQTVYIAYKLSNFLGSALFAFEDALKDFSWTAQSALGVDGPTTVQWKNNDVNLFGARYDLSFHSAGKKVATRKPFVSVECAGYSPGTASLALLHDQLTLAPWNSESIQSVNWSVPSSDYSDLIVDLNSLIVNSSVIDIEQFDGFKPSLGVFFSTPEVKTGFPDRLSTLNTNFSMYACTVDARWIETQVFLDASRGRRAIFDFNSKRYDAPSIYMSKSWARALTVPWIDSILTPIPGNRSMFDIIGQRCLDSTTFYNDTMNGKVFDDGLSHRITTSPTGMHQCLQASLATTLAEAASRVQDFIPTYFVAEGHNLAIYNEKYYEKDVFLVSNIYGRMPSIAIKTPYPNDGRIRNIFKADFQDPNRFTEISMPVQLWSYGYGFHGSILVYVGLVVLLMHLALSLCYITWILWKGDYYRTGWDTIGGLVSMAMRSGTAEEKEFEDKKQRWTARVAVREVGQGESNSAVASKNLGQEKQILVLRKVEAFDQNKGDV